MLLPNTEGIVIAAVKETPAIVQAKAVVAAELPAEATFPAVRVTRVGGAPAVAAPLVLDEALLQVDVFATRKQQAWDLVNAVRDRLADLAGGHRLGWVTGSRVEALTYLPDDTFPTSSGSAMPRYVQDVRVWAKPTASL